MSNTRTTAATGPDRSKSLWVGYAAALWALTFAVLHVVWAMGWYVGLHQELARKAFQKRWFLIYDLVVAGVCALAVAVALAMVQQWGRRLPRRLISALAWSGTILLVLRGGAGALQTGWFAATGRKVLFVFAIWEVWFCLGAILFGLTLWRFRRAP
jgi:hypothetical protein